MPANPCPGPDARGGAGADTTVQQAGRARSPHVRQASLADLTAIAQVAVAAGQIEEWTGADPAYVRHLLDHGLVVVAEQHGTVAGFGAVRRIGPAQEPARTGHAQPEHANPDRANPDRADPGHVGAGAVTMLCDLFVSPRSHGQGLGQAMLSALWRRGTPRMAFSSLHAHALPLYTRAGLDAWWPLLYLAGDVAEVGRPAGLTVGESSAQEVSDLERAWTRLDRSSDIRAWASRPAGHPVTVSRHGEPLAAGVVAGAGPGYGITHLASAPHLSDQGARDAVLAVLAALDAPGGRARVCLPAPHPAVRPLLARGWRVEFTDLFMSTDPALLDPRRAVPCPALA